MCDRIAHTYSCLLLVEDIHLYDCSQLVEPSFDDAVVYGTAILTLDQGGHLLLLYPERVLYTTTIVTMRVIPGDRTGWAMCLVHAR